MDKKWFALYTKPRAEFKAQVQISSLDIECYLPTITTLKQWSDRKKKVTEPLFSGYMFIFADEKERLLSLEQPAIVKTISFQGRPAVVPDWQIFNLKKLMSNEPDVTVVNKLPEGTKVKVVAGPFRDVEGTIIQVSKDQRQLAITIDILNRSVVVHLTAANVVEKTNR